MVDALGESEWGFAKVDADFHILKEKRRELRVFRDLSRERVLKRF